jgi:GT2 family glycosyltransferase
MMTRRDVYNQVGEFDDEVDELADVDYCLRLITRGYRVVFTPYSALVAAERSPSTIDNDSRSQDLLQSRWGDYLRRDPYYNPNFSRDTPDYELRLTGIAPQDVDAEDRSHGLTKAYEE